MPNPRRAAALTAILSLTALFAVACEHRPMTPGVPATITVTPDPQTLETSTSQQFVATATDADGNVVGIEPTWSVQAGGGTIDGSGVFVAGQTLGTFDNTVVATLGSLSGNATVTVVPKPLATITVTPDPVTLEVGESQQFTAVGRDLDGNEREISPVWSVSEGGGTIDQDGVFTAGTEPGSFPRTVTATSAGVSGHASVTVVAGPLASMVITPNPTTLAVKLSRQFTATGSDAHGNPVSITPVWSVTDGGGVIGVSGLFTAGDDLGTFENTVRASVGDISARATVHVVAGALASISVTPDPATMGTDETQQFSAVGRDAGGNPVSITPTWAVVAGGGSIDASTGAFTAGGDPGTFTNTVRASVAELAGFATVIVTGPELASITVTPNPVSVQTNGTQQFVAVGKDQDGNDFVLENAVWSVENGGGTINSNTGLFTAGGTAGTFNNTVRATSGTISGSATVTVTDPGPELATITVSPDPTSVATNGTRQFSAVGRDGDGNLFPISPTWAVVNGGGTINASTGLFTAGPSTGTFNETVQATSGSISGTATVTVTAMAPPPIVDLGTAAPNGIMAGTEVTCVAGGLISADVAISPGSTITGFPPCTITGDQNLANAIAAQAQIDLTNAYNDLAGLPCSASNAIVGNLGGTTQPAGVYCTASGIGVTGTLTLDGGGDPNATFVFQAGTSLTTAGNIVLINGAQAKNVWWQVGSSATIGTASQWQGNIITLTSITLVDNATLLGRALARNGAVSLGSNNTITLPPL